MRLLFTIVALLGVLSASGLFGVGGRIPGKKREAESADAPKPPELPPWRFEKKREAEELESAGAPKPAPPVGPPFRIKKSYPEGPSVTTTLKPASENGPSFMASFKKREAEEMGGGDPIPIGPSQKNDEGPSFQGKKREAEEIPNKRAAEECDGVPPLPSCRKKLKRTADSPDKRAAGDDDRKELKLPPWRFEQKRGAEELESAGAPKPAPPVGPPFMAKRDAEELEIAGAPKPASPVGPSIKGKKREAEELENPCFEQDPKLPGCRKFKRTADSPDKRAAGDGDQKELKLPPWRFEQKRGAEELESAGAPKPAPPVGPPFRSKRDEEELESDEDRKPASPVGPSIKGKKREAEELEKPCFENDPSLPSCRKKFARTADSPDKRATGDDDRKEPKLPPWRFEQKRETEELEIAGAPKPAPPVGPPFRSKRDEEKLENQTLE